MNVGEVRLVDDELCLITSGQYRGEYGVSNYWTWRKIKKDGTLSKKEYAGYNNGEFIFSPPIEHEVIIRIKK